MTLKTQIKPYYLGPVRERAEGESVAPSILANCRKEKISLELFYFLPCVMLLDLISFLLEDTLVLKAMT